MMDTLTNFKSILRVFLMTVPNIQMEKWNVISYFFLVLLNWPPFSKKSKRCHPALPNILNHRYCKR